ncbi:MAG: transcriptional regulator [Bacillota bacterium]|nr:MAG: transcriptional regulator [Bacillota bacterium]
MPEARVCPRYERAVQVLGKKWTGLIIRVLLSGKKRFCELKASMPELSDRVLSERLKELEDEGIVARRVHNTRPVLIEYELTPKGRELEAVVAAIQRWADRWYASAAGDPAAGGGTAGGDTVAVRRGPEAEDRSSPQRQGERAGDRP